MNTPVKDIQARFRLDHGSFLLDVNLRLPGQGVTALYGPSGSGKTSCLRCVAGLERAGEAYLEVNGEVWQDTRQQRFVPTHARAIGYVFQEASLFAHLSVQGNLQYGLKRIPTAERRIDLDQACELLGIEHLLQRRPERLSGGERQRVGIARALLTSPKLLLMDEPLAALDAARKAEVLPYLERLQRELELPILYVTHSRDEVARLADHLVLLDQGRILASGPVTELLARTDLPTAAGDDAGVVIDTQVLGHDSQYGLLDLGLPGSGLHLRIAHEPLPLAGMLRIKIQARDVSLNLHREADSSILNVLPAIVREIVVSENPAHVLVRLDVAGTTLLARITRYSSDRLGLSAGSEVWAQVKSVAVAG